MRQFARVLMKGECCLYGQHFKGAFNSVSDVLSQLHDHTDNNLTTYLFSSFPEQVPNTFAIAPLLPCIFSQMILFLQKTKEIKESQKAPKRKRNEHGNDGLSFVSTSKTTMIPTCKISSQNSGLESLEPLPLCYDNGSFHDLMKCSWQQAQFKRP